MTSCQRFTERSPIKLQPHSSRQLPLLSNSEILKFWNHASSCDQWNLYITTVSVESEGRSSMELISDHSSRTPDLVAWIFKRSSSGLLAEASILTKQHHLHGLYELSQCFCWIQDVLFVRGLNFSALVSTFQNDMVKCKIKIREKKLPI